MSFYVAAVSNMSSTLSLSSCLKCRTSRFGSNSPVPIRARIGSAMGSSFTRRCVTNGSVCIMSLTEHIGRWVWKRSARGGCVGMSP